MTDPFVTDPLVTDPLVTDPEQPLGLDQNHALDRDCTTLSRHVLQQFQSFSPEAQDLSALMSRIALAAKLIARRLTRAGLSAPLAFLIEQAGGRASTGLQEIMDVIPDRLHARTPLIIGSKEDVALVESFIQEEQRERHGINPQPLSKN